MSRGVYQQQKAPFLIGCDVLGRDLVYFPEGVANEYSTPPYPAMVLDTDCDEVTYPFPMTVGFGLTYWPLGWCDEFGGSHPPGAYDCNGNRFSLDFDTYLLPAPVYRSGLDGLLKAAAIISDAGAGVAVTYGAKPPNKKKATKEVNGSRPAGKRKAKKNNAKKKVVGNKPKNSHHSDEVVVVGLEPEKAIHHKVAAPVDPKPFVLGAEVSLKRCIPMQKKAEQREQLEAIQKLLLEALDSVVDDRLIVYLIYVTYKLARMEPEAIGATAKQGMLLNDYCSKYNDVNYKSHLGMMMLAIYATSPIPEHHVKKKTALTELGKTALLFGTIVAGNMFTQEAYLKNIKTCVEATSAPDQVVPGMIEVDLARTCFFPDFFSKFPEKSPPGRIQERFKKQLQDALMFISKR